MLEVSPQCLEDVQKDPSLASLAKSPEGLEASLQSMAKHAAHYTGVQGNRRYDDYVLYIANGVLYEVSLLGAEVTHCATCDGAGLVEVHDECPECGGERCVYCAFDGVVPRYIQCPDCT